MTQPDLEKLARDCANQINPPCHYFGSNHCRMKSVEEVGGIINDALTRATESVRAELEQVNTEALAEGARFNSELLQECAELRAQLATARAELKEQEQLANVALSDLQNCQEQHEQLTKSLAAAKASIQREIDKSDCSACRVFLSGVIAAMAQQKGGG